MIGRRVDDDAYRSVAAARTLRFVRGVT